MSYDFLPSNHPRGYGTTAPQARTGAAEDESPNGPTVEEASDDDDDDEDQHMETGTTQHGHYASSDGGDASTKANMTINVEGGDAEDGNNGVDELSQMSDHLSLGGRPPKANKRRRHGDAKDGTTIISLTVKLDMEPSAIVTTLTTTLGSEVSNTFTGEIVYAAYARDVALKDVYLTVAESVDIAALLRQLTAAFPRSYPQVVGGIPRQPHDASDLDTSPVHGGAPNNCRVKCCPHHYHPFDSAGGGGFQTATNHGRHLHGTFYRALADPVLASIGWYCCRDGCDGLFLGDAEYQKHRATCAALQVKVAAAHRPRDDAAYAPLFGVIPQDRHDELDGIIQAQLDGEGFDQHATNAAIVGIVLEVNAGTARDTGHT